MSSFEEKKQMEDVVYAARKQIQYDTKELRLEVLNNILEESTPDFDRLIGSKTVEQILIGFPLEVLFLVEVNEKNYPAKLKLLSGKTMIDSFNAFIAGEFKLSGLTVVKELNGNTFADLPSSLKRCLKLHSFRAICFEGPVDQIPYTQKEKEL